MIRPVAGGVQLQLHVQPGARTSALAGQHGEAIKVRLAAPPIDGRANEALLAFIALTAGVASRDVILLRGASSRQKLVQVTGITVDRAAELFLGS